MDRGTCCDQVQFRGSLLELTELARCARAGLGGEIGSLESLPAFDERAADIRQEWSRMGWMFTQDSMNGQVSEVMNWHFETVGRGIQEVG
mmetsp:Transcript_20759/g.45655  ORF Transcript_20759/g.45655 Transcript_20759/m.45655 type:complete len:90 (-) Transcript_20759:131-400(-)